MCQFPCHEFRIGQLGQTPSFFIDGKNIISPRHADIDQAIFLPLAMLAQRDVIVFIVAAEMDIRQHDTSLGEFAFEPAPADRVWILSKKSEAKIQYF